MARAVAVWRKVLVSNLAGRSVQNFCLLKVRASTGALRGVATWGRVLYTAMMCSRRMQEYKKRPFYAFFGSQNGSQFAKTLIYSGELWR